MEDVAAYKFANGLPIEDPAREATVLADAAASARRYGLTPDSVERLFLAQIEAAKEIQAYWIGRWASGAPAPSPPDLANDLRPRLTALGEALLAQAARAPLPAAHRLPPMEGLGAAAAAALEAALAGIERFPSRLEQIVATGVLRVGTTGDYAPFSIVDAADEGYQGIDVDLAQDLAASLGVELELVPTTWPTLLDDLASGSFDVVMGGVSRTLARQQLGFFSTPYYVGGKSAISRCEDAPRFGSLEAIDRPGVRVIVNPGGTNEQFVASRVHRAEVIVHDDNRTIFAEIVAGRADVMITDSIEVELNAREGTGLCAAMAGFLSYQEKGYLLPRDVALKEYVDLWLALRLGDGTVAEAFERHGVTWRPPAGVAPAQNSVR